MYSAEAATHRRSPEEVKAAFASWLTARREAQYQSQGALLRELKTRGLELSRTTVSKWERGQSLPAEEHRPALWSALRVTMWAQRLGMALDGWDVFPGEGFQVEPEPA